MNSSFFCTFIASTLRFYIFIFFNFILANENITFESEFKQRIYLASTTGQLFTELYDKHALLKVPHVNVFQPATYIASAIARNLSETPADVARADKLLKEYLTEEGTLELYLDPKTIPSLVFFPCTGATQVYEGLVYAIVSSNPNKQFLFVQKIPYYSGHRSAIDDFKYENAEYVGYHSPEDIEILRKGKTVVEFVTSANNPDGTFREPETNPDIIIADLVFSSDSYGPRGNGYVQRNLKWIKEARKDKTKHLFSFDSASKHFGKTGDRWGWIWFDFSDPYQEFIFDKFQEFINSAGDVGTQGGALFLDLISALLNTDDKGKNIFHNVNQSLQKRHCLVEKQLKIKYPHSEVTSVPGSPTLFAKIHDRRLAYLSAADIILQDVNTLVKNGEDYGENKSFVRINLCGSSNDMANFLNRLAGKKVYTPDNVIVSNVDLCPCQTIISSSQNETHYYVEPGDCTLVTDTQCGNITITFPAFIGFYEQVITIKKPCHANLIELRLQNINGEIRTFYLEGVIMAEIKWSQKSEESGDWKIIQIYTN